jgi:cytosine permease
MGRSFGSRSRLPRTDNHERDVSSLGLHWAGYIAWALGFIVGIFNHIPGVPAGLVAADHPAALYAFVVGFVVYWALAKAGLRSPVIPECQLTPPVLQSASKVP